MASTTACAVLMSIENAISSAIFVGRPIYASVSYPRDADRDRCRIPTLPRLHARASKIPVCPTDCKGPLVRRDSGVELQPFVLVGQRTDVSVDSRIHFVSSCMPPQLAT